MNPTDKTHKTAGLSISRSGPCPDLIAEHRSRDGVSSAAANPRQQLPLPQNSNVTSALDTTGSTPIPPNGMPTVGTPRLLTADDVAVMLRVPRSLIYALVRRGDLPGIRIGERYVRFRAEAVERWLERREQVEPHRSEPSGTGRTINTASGSPPTADRGASGTSLRRRVNAPEPGIRRVDPDAS